MKRTIMAAMVLSLAVGSLALADPPQDYHHDRDQRQDQRQDQRHDEHRDREHHDRGEHRGEMREHARFDSGRYMRPHGYSAHRWRRGDRLPPAYRSSAYVIPDYAVYHLRPPPRGYYWVRVDNNAVLAAVATGVVVGVSINLFH